MCCDSSQEGIIYKQIFPKFVNFLQSAKKPNKIQIYSYFLQLNYI